MRAHATARGISAAAPGERIQFAFLYRRRPRGPKKWRVLETRGPHEMRRPRTVVTKRAEGACCPSHVPRKVACRTNHACRPLRAPKGTKRLRYLNALKATKKTLQGRERPQKERRGWRRPNRPRLLPCAGSSRSPYISRTCLNSCSARAEFLMKRRTKAL